MNRLLATIVLLAMGNSLLAQNAAAQLFADADKEQNWKEHFDGKTLTDWQATGVVEIKEGLLLLGGPPTTTLQSKAPLGAKFKILIECKSDGPVSPNLQLQTRTMLSRGATGGSILLKPGEWTELLLVGAPNPDGNVVLDAFARTMADKKTQPVGQFGGHGEASVLLEVPPGGKMTIRRIRVETVVSPSASSFLAIGILAIALLCVVVVGWMVNRRKRDDPVG